MSDLMHAIADDMDEYGALCRRFGEEPRHNSNGNADCYGVHAMQLGLRAKREDDRAVGKKVPVEVEIKLPVDEGTICRLEKELGNSWNGDKWVRQENVIYRNDNGFMRFRREGRSAKLTLKGKNSSGRYNQRTEVECEIPVDFFESALRMAAGEGVVVYEKRRASYFSGNCTICLDNLGGRYFVEIEGAMADINRSIRKLRLEGIPTEKRDYAEIIGDGI